MDAPPPAEAPPPADEPLSAEAPPPVSEAPAAPTASARRLGARTTLARGLDLSLAANRDVRRASVYIGLLTLATIGPFAIIVLGIAQAEGGFGWLAAMLLEAGPLPIDPGLASLLLVCGIVAVLGYIVIAVESQIVVAALLGSRALDRPLSVRESLGRSRQVFWRVVAASILLGILLQIPNLVLEMPLAATFGPFSEASVLLTTAIGILLGAPFAYLVTGIVIGDVGPIQAITRSTRLARSRWRLAILISAVGAVVAWLQIFAVGAGVDILARIGVALNLGFEPGSGGAFAIGVLVLLAVLSIGSLTVTVAALIVAPQVVAFVALTGDGPGLERARDATGGGGHDVPWLTAPMTLLIVLGVILGVAGIRVLT